MKICQVIESGGGSGRTMLFVASHLIKLGHDVTLIYSPVRQDPQFAASIQATKGLRIVPMEIQRELGWHDVLATFRLYKKLRELGPFDIIHSHSSKAGGLARLAGLFLPKAKQIYTPHAFITMDPGIRRLFYGTAEWILSHFCQAIIAVSVEEHTHAVHALHIPANKIHVIPNAAVLDYPAERNTARKIMGAADHAFVIGFVGRLVPQKRPERAIETFALIAKDYPNARLVMVGDGPLAAESHALAETTGLKDRIIFLEGYDARDLMPGFDTLFCSSDFEGFATVYLEALAAGLPIVTTSVGGALQSVIDGDTGFKTADFSPASLAALLKKMLDLPPQERTQMSKHAKIHAREFTLDKMNQRTWEIYRQVTASPSPLPPHLDYEQDESDSLDARNPVIENDERKAA